MSRHRGASAAMLALALVALFGVQLTRSAGAAEPQTATVGNTVESWYATVPAGACSSPVGCPLPIGGSAAYPADTLHVGLAAEQETARAYLLPDLSLVPSTAAVSSATMTLPLASDPEAGTQSPDVAQVKACLATQRPTEEAQGATGVPPTVDCAVTAALRYVAASNGLTLDLLPFIAAWDAGKPRFGIALVPEPGTTSPPASWHLAFDRRTRSGGTPISTVISYTLPDAPPPPVAPEQPTVEPPAPPIVEVPSGPAPVAAPPVVLDPVGPPPPPTLPQTQPSAQVTIDLAYRYPRVFYVPLLLLAGTLFLARLFTRDATPLELRRP